jgi:anti-sigma regulatory factor (Ser/Thr protein kinase)
MTDRDGLVLQFELKSHPDELAGVRQKLRDYIGALGWPDEPIGEIELAVDEALSNIIRHGYRDTSDAWIEIECEPCEQAAEGVEIRIRDYCPHVDLGKISGRSLDEVRPGGLGVHLIRAMMESVEYQHAAGGGVLLIMRKSKQHRARYEPSAGDD